MFSLATDVSVLFFLRRSFSFQSCYSGGGAVEFTPEAVWVDSIEEGSRLSALLRASAASQGDAEA